MRVLLIGAVLAAGSAFASRGEPFGEIVAPEQLDAGQRANFFALWAGSEAVRGVVVELPEGWSLRDASVVREDRRSAVPVIVEPLAGREGSYRVEAAMPLRGAVRFVLQVEVGRAAGLHRWSLAPLLEGGAHRFRRGEPAVRSAHVTAPALPTRHRTPDRALALSRPAKEPVLLRRAALPALDAGSPFTVEFWMKTVGLDQIVLSTWDGTEAQPYPLELVVDGRGQLLFYRGRPGRHQSLASARPVADGRWHHVALTHDPAGAWTRLYVDGLAADSLLARGPLSAANDLPLGIGSRPNARPGAAGPLPYEGLFDELRFWSQARPPALLRRMMRQPAEERPGLVRLDFDGGFSQALFLRRPAASQRVASDLELGLPVFLLRASGAEGAVLLRWEAAERQAERFVVERSMDGQRFDPIGELPAGAGDGPERLAFTDPQAGSGVRFYRIRQQFRDGGERLSNIVKLGLGAEEQQPALLIGNFPNPFKTSTVLSYELQRPMPVSLTVWDVSGQQVAQLVDETRPAGLHEVRFSAYDLPTGIYFVRLHTPAGVQIRKMLLMR